MAAIGMAPALGAQEHAHEPGMTHEAANVATAASPAGQSAFGTIAAIVRLLEEDSRTDWSKVNIEGLRQHLIDMEEVTMQSRVVSENVGGGARFVVTGSGRTVDAIRRMANAHSQMLGKEAGMRAVVETIPSGARVTVLADKAGDMGAVAKIRGLGFVGLLTLGDHHGPHHLLLAKGTMPEGHAPAKP